MALTAALPAATAVCCVRGVARARASAPARNCAAPQRMASLSMQAALVAAPLAPARKALAPRNCCRVGRRSAAVASAGVPPLADAKVITLTCALALLHPLQLRLVPRLRAEALSGADAPATRSSGVGPLLPASSGVYAVYDAAGALQYVGMSRKARGA